MAEWIYGINPVREALFGSQRKPLELFIDSNSRSSRLRELLKEASKTGIPVRQRRKEDIDRLAGHCHHQGVLLRVAPFAYVSFSDVLEKWRNSGQKAFFVVLDGITDPHNFGAILRSADAAGCHGVIVSKDRSCSVTPVVDKVSAGALAYVPICQVTNLARTLDELKKEGLWVFGLAGEVDSQSLYKTDLSGDMVLVVGSEGAGLRTNVRKHCDVLISIPMRGGVSSLNASVAAAVAFFEAVRQRST